MLCPCTICRHQHLSSSMWDSLSSVLLQEPGKKTTILALQDMCGKGGVGVVVSSISLGTIKRVSCCMRARLRDHTAALSSSLVLHSLPCSSSSRSNHPMKIRMNSIGIKEDQSSQEPLCPKPVSLVGGSSTDTGTWPPQTTQELCFVTSVNVWLFLIIWPSQMTQSQCSCESKWSYILLPFKDLFVLYIRKNIQCWTTSIQPFSFRSCRGFIATLSCRVSLALHAQAGKWAITCRGGKKV